MKIRNQIRTEDDVRWVSSNDLLIIIISHFVIEESALQQRLHWSIQIKTDVKYDKKDDGQIEKEEEGKTLQLCL